MVSGGSCLDNPGPGGWSVLLRWVRAGAVPHEKLLSGGEASATNNRMELLAAVMGFEALKEPCAVTLITDSQYLGGIVKGNKARANLDLVTRLRTALQPHTVSVVKVAGHSGNADNERVDAEARRQAEAQKAQVPGGGAGSSVPFPLAGVAS